jgi:hypothetical protein
LKSDAAHLSEAQFGGTRNGLLEGKPTTDMHQDKPKPQAGLLKSTGSAHETVLAGESVEIGGKPGGEDSPVLREGVRIGNHAVSMSTTA